jgi:hypothetical protein
MIYHFVFIDIHRYSDQAMEYPSSNIDNVRWIPRHNRAQSGNRFEWKNVSYEIHVGQKQH